MFRSDMPETGLLLDEDGVCASMPRKLQEGQQKVPPQRLRRVIILTPAWGETSESLVNPMDAEPDEPHSQSAEGLLMKNDDRQMNDRQMDEKKFRQNSRRELLKLAPVLALGAFAIPGLQDRLLKKGLAFSDWAQARLFRSGHLAPTFDTADLTPPAKFPINGYDVDDPGVDLDTWTLTVSGAVKKPGEYTLAQVQALPRYRQNTRHICVEGWDVIGRFGGARLSDFLQLVGADPAARFISVECADDYYESLDMATALHPQTLLCYEMYEQPLTRQHGAPLRLNIPTKVGYKQAKYLTDLRVSHVLERVGFWEDQGYSWFYGL
jgi:DMSO/TMAO reductase YedYZ molybdopterin-dependent catalytic subunit